jgi:hypothetical protein
MFKEYKSDKDFIREKEIEEMLKIANANICPSHALYDAGYRQQSKVIEKFSKKVIDFLDGYDLFDKEYFKRKLTEIGEEIIGEKNEEF